MITLSEIYNADRTELEDILSKLIVDKMKLDKFFSVFLDNTELEDTNTDTDDWVTYKEMLKDYERVDHLITTTRYHLNQYV
jgi:hypothetical protein